MLKKLAHLWNDLFAPKDWDASTDGETPMVMRRWRNGAWEYREASEEEVRDTLYWQAIK